MSAAGDRLTFYAMLGAAIPDGRKRCCDLDTGGSHYHCGRCGEVTGMYGHSTGMEHRDGKARDIERHFCCPGDCEKPEAHR